MTVQDLVRLSLLNIGVLAEGEDPTASQQKDAITTMNMMLDAWSVEKLFIYTVAQETFNFVGGQQIYEMGPTAADFVTSRPLYIESAFVRVDYGNPQQVDIPLAIFNIDQWSRISVKNTSSVFPTRIYFSTDFPNAKIYAWPIPQQSNIFYVVSWKPLSAMEDPTAEFQLPPGFANAIMYNLAYRLCPMFGKPVMPDIADLAALSKGRVKKSLEKFYLMRTDDGLLPPDKVFNYLTGE